MKVTVAIPRLLAEIADADREIVVDATTVRGSLEALCRLHPALTVHLFDEGGALRPNVNCFHNGARWRDDPAMPIAEGDEVMVLQAVSGGGRRNSAGPAAQSTQSAGPVCLS